MGAKNYGKLIKTQTIMDALLLDTGLSPTELNLALYPGKKLNSQVYRWRAGTRAMNRSNFVRIRKYLNPNGYRPLSRLPIMDPDSPIRKLESIYFFSLFDLLNNSNYKRKQLNKITRSFVKVTDSGKSWGDEGRSTFIKTSQPVKIHKRHNSKRVDIIFFEPIDFEDSEKLATLQEPLLFFYILALVRYAEVDKDDQAHLRHSINLYKAISSINKNEYLAKHFDAILQATDVIICRVPNTKRYLPLIKKWLHFSSSLDTSNWQQWSTLISTDGHFNRILHQSIQGCQCNQLGKLYLML